MHACIGDQNMAEIFDEVDEVSSLLMGEFEHFIMHVTRCDARSNGVEQPDAIQYAILDRLENKHPKPQNQSGRHDGYFVGTVKLWPQTERN